ncbi:RagB/SusD family nutrient uptake outer membrane protein [Hymenobacter sp. 15J16-1T3B]|uniref:RagB/SusD family nutrient uptake outer membrane protein n=1 Tax=Hymenobacter sp. 15J16-1T3B TaxID=2886941 RepID=UPI001D126EAF|nr:RagB/SusD family nutrient uptake outer membrane protein [Hymenobacter sp. 15J16-1T3B]MCC3157322.1 RagB/SusD family nutrient uptake outer membrane protein [Hymenobacter sp. 15J16-1T3B]
MKTIFFRSAVALSLGLTLGLTACEKQLDLDPRQSVDAATALDSEAKVGSAVVGLYAKLDDPSLYGTQLLLIPEILGGNGYLSWQGSFTTYRDLLNRTTNSLNGLAESTWRLAYQNINQANLVIDALPVVATPDLKAQYEGEARFIRADMLFELVRLYAQQYNSATAGTELGVPLPLAANRTLTQADTDLPRATVAAVYAQVITDLEAAIRLLPEDNGTRASKYTAEALLARVYLQQNRYALAAAQAEDVINNSNKALSPTLVAVFRNRNSSESLFEIQQNDQNNAGTANNGLATLYANIGQLGRGDIRVLGGLVNQYEDSDARGTDSLTFNFTRKLIYVGDGPTRGSNQLRSGKWTAYGQNIPVIRLAEMYLIRAEGRLAAGNTTGALDDVNTVRERSGASELTTISREDIWRERQLELAFEGFRLHDIKRTGQPLEYAGAGGTVTVPSNSPRLVLPIPQRELNVNPALTQNTSY